MGGGDDKNDGKDGKGGGLEEGERVPAAAGLPTQLLEREAMAAAVTSAPGGTGTGTVPGAVPVPVPVPATDEPPKALQLRVDYATNNQGYDEEAQNGNDKEKEKERERESGDGRPKKRESKKKLVMAPATHEEGINNNQNSGSNGLAVEGLEEPAAPGDVVQAQAIDEEAREEEFRQRMLKNVVTATEIDPNEKKKTEKSTNRASPSPPGTWEKIKIPVMIVWCIVVIVAIVLAIVLPDALNDGENDERKSMPDPPVGGTASPTSGPPTSAPPKTTAPPTSAPVPQWLQNANELFDIIGPWTDTTMVDLAFFEERYQEQPPPSLPPNMTFVEYVLARAAADNETAATMDDDRNTTNDNPMNTPQSLAFEWIAFYDDYAKMNLFDDDMNKSMPESSIATTMRNGDGTDGNNVDDNSENYQWQLLERFALAVLYFSTGGPSYWSNQLRFLSNATVCDWPNVGGNETNAPTPNEVDCNSDGHVIKIRIEFNDMKGTIPSELSALSFLDILSIAVAELTGTIPTELGLLTRLSFLQFVNVGLTGTIPENELLLPLSNLQLLSFYNNDLTGTLPVQFLSSEVSSNMDTLDLGNNDFTGTFPSSLSTTSLNILYLENNELEGPILSSLTEQVELGVLSVTNNQFNGTIPEYTNIEENDDGDDDVTGWGDSLLVAWLESNQFSGTIPTSIGYWQDMFQFQVTDNLLTGSIPTEIGNLIFRLSEVDVSSNDLSGTLPEEISNLASLRSLSVARNPRLGGTIPVSYRSLGVATINEEDGKTSSPSLVRLAVDGTNITGDSLELAFCELPNGIIEGGNDFIVDNNDTNSSNNSSSSSSFTNDILITSIVADCGTTMNTTSPELECSCCTSCCIDGEDCTLEVESICELRAGSFELNQDADDETGERRNPTCTCTDDGSRFSCTDQGCRSCTYDGRYCARNTDYGFTFDLETGDVTSFSNTIQYDGSRDGDNDDYYFNGWNLTFVETLDDGCELFVNNEQCRDCSRFTCISGFEGYSFFCDNLQQQVPIIAIVGEDGDTMVAFEPIEPIVFNACEEFVNAGYLSIFFAFDESALSGCPLLLERV